MYQGRGTSCLGPKKKMVQWKSTYRPKVSLKRGRTIDPTLHDEKKREK